MKSIIKSVSIILSWMFCFSQQGYSQHTVYASTLNNDILELEPFSCNYQVVMYGSSLQTQLGSFIDIAIEEYELYGCGSDGSIYRINTSDGGVEWVNETNFSPINVSGMVGDQNGHLYLSGLSLYRYTISSNMMENVGGLGYTTQGDLEFYNGAFYIAAGDSSGMAKLVKVQLDPFTVTEIGATQYDVFGMAKFGGFGENKFLASRDSTLLVLDINSGGTSVICPNIFDGTAIFGMSEKPDDLGINDQTLTGHVRISQNNHEVIVEIDPITPGNPAYTVYNALGQKQMSGNISSGKTVINLPEQSSGILIFSVEEPNGQTVQKKLIIP